MTVRLSMYGPITMGTGFISGLPADGWRRSIRRDGGFWSGNFSIVGDFNSLASFFYNRMGAHIVEDFNGRPTWEGFIHSMDFTYKGVTRRRTYANMANAVKVKFTDMTGGGVSSTLDWITNDESIARHGRREEVVTLGELVLPEAEAAQQNILKRFAWPTARPIAVHGVEESRIDVTVVGYVVRCNWVFHKGTGNPSTPASDLNEDSTPHDVWRQLSNELIKNGSMVVSQNSDPGIIFNEDVDYTIDYANGLYIVPSTTSIPSNGAHRFIDFNYEYLTLQDATTIVKSIIAAEYPFLTEGIIEQNDLLINQELATDQRSYDYLKHIIDLGDDAGDPWVFYVTEDRLAHYIKMPTEPTHFLSEGLLYSSVGLRDIITPYELRPGVIRDMDYFIEGSQPDSWLPDDRDMWIDEISVDENRRFNLTTSLI